MNRKREELEIKKEEMIRNRMDALMAKPLRASPAYNLEYLMDSTSFLETRSRPYLSHRLLNHVRSKSMRREWTRGRNILDTYTFEAHQRIEDTLQLHSRQTARSARKSIYL